MLRATSARATTVSAATSVRLLYVGYYLALGAFLPYINLYFERIGLTGIQIGFLAAGILIVASLTAIPWGAIADRFQLHQQILAAALFLAPVTVFFLSRAASFDRMVPLVLAYALCTAPIISLLDGSALEIAREYHLTYGELRVGGTIGWIISVWLVGILIEAFGIHWLFYVYITFMILTFIYAIWRPPRRGSAETILWANFRRLTSDTRVLPFLISVFMVAVGSGAVMNFFSLYLDGIGATEGIIGAAWAIAAISEIPVMLYAGALMRRIGAAGLLKLACTIYVVRWLLLSYIRDPGLALATQLLHGLSFAAFLTAGVTYLSQRTPQGLSTTAQAVFNVVCFGLASMTGAMLGGYLYDAVGMADLLRLLSIITLGGLFLFWGTERAERTVHDANA